MYNLLKELRENPETAAAGKRWTPEEELLLLESITNDKDIEAIAKEHKRTAGGITSRLRDIAIRMIETDGKSIQEVCDTLRLTHEEIQDAQKRRAAAKNKKTTPPPKPETELQLLKDIHEILVRIEAKLLND